MGVQCIYCGRTYGGTRDHIVPKSLLKDLNKFTGKTVNPPKDNIAPCCGWCNSAKGHRFIPPTAKNIKTVYINTPSMYIKSLADWVVNNKKILQHFFSDEVHRDFYNVTSKQISEVISLKSTKYYDKLDNSKINMPGNEFIRSSLSVTELKLICSDITLADKRHIEKIVDVYKQQQEAKLGEHFNNKKAFAKKIRAYLNEHLNKDLYMFIGEEDNKIVLMCSLIVINYMPCHNDTGKHGHICDIYISSFFNFRETVIELINKCINFAKSNNISKLSLETDNCNTKQIYNIVGFKDSTSRLIMAVK